MTFRFTDFEIDIARHELRRSGEVVHIEPQVFDLLVHLIRNRDRIVSKDELIDTVWQGRIVSEATLSSRISAARRALDDSGNDQCLIRTLHKRGFRFVGHVDDGSSAPAAVANDKAPPLQVVAHGVAELVPSGEPLPLLDRPSIAIPPFRNIGLAPDQDDLADGLTAAAAPPPAPPDGAPAAAGGHAVWHGDRWVDPAAVENGTASAGRPAAQYLLFAVALIGLASLLVTAGWWLLPSSFPSAYALLGRSDDARASLAAYLQRRPGTRISTFRRLSPVPLVLTAPQYQQQHERLTEGLRKAGMPE